MSDIIKISEDMSDREIMDAKYPKQKLKQQPDANLHQIKY